MTDETNEQQPKRGVGRPPKDPALLVHNTRERHFLPIERNPSFDAAVERARIKIAKERTAKSGQTVDPESVSKTAAVKLAIFAFIAGE